MIKQEDEKWLKKTLEDCFKHFNAKTAKEKRLLEGFSLLTKHMIRNMEGLLNEARALWEIKPDSEEVREKLDILHRCMRSLKKYCDDKIERKK